MRVKAAESTEELVSVLHNWQNIENATVKHTTEVIAKTKNPLIQLVMEIIRQDSTMHHRVQQVIEKHAEMEKETIRLAEKALSRCRLFVQRHLLTYLIEDEKKHDRLLGQLEDFKRNIYPYA